MESSLQQVALQRQSLIDENSGQKGQIIELQQTLKETREHMEQLHQMLLTAQANAAELELQKQEAVVRKKISRRKI